MVVDKPRQKRVIVSEPSIVYEDDWLLVVNKPAGMVVNRAESVHTPTLQDWTEGKLERQISKLNMKTDIDSVFRARGGIAHRLDKDTSGVLLIGKSPKMLKELMDQFKNRQVDKEYSALVHGRVEPAVGWVRVPIARRPGSGGKFGVDPLGRKAETHYRREKLYTVEGLDNQHHVYSFMTAWPTTGRTHQIRVHCKHIGHPLAGDSLYATEKQLVIDRVWLDRHFLHAVRIGFMHPLTRQEVEYRADLADDLLHALSGLREHDGGKL